MQIYLNIYFLNNLTFYLSLIITLNKKNIKYITIITIELIKYQSY